MALVRIERVARAGNTACRDVARLRYLHAVTPPTFHLSALFFTTSMLSLPETKLAASALRSVSFHPVADSHG